MDKGSCLCGAVHFTIEGDLAVPSACHCSKCRKHTGHYEAGTDIPRSALAVEGAEKITWYFSSEKVRRGFCKICGSSLFFDMVDDHRIGVAMGAFDTPTHTRLGLHIFVADKGDYYEIADGPPQYQTIPASPPTP
ncbi:MAG: GFA family protein [Devosia sp.]